MNAKLGRSIAVLSSLCLAFSAHAMDAKVAMEEFMVPASDPGISLYVRNKHPEGVNRFAADKILLYVHGATYPAETAFDLKVGGLSWMDYIARRGYDVYLGDVRGYGKSTRPPEMDQPAPDNAPMVHAAAAVKDVGSAVEFIRKRRGVDKINLIGWSWGTSIMGWYTAQNNDKVNKLVLYAPGWLRKSASLTDSGAKLGAYRTVTREAAKARRVNGGPDEKKGTAIPAGGWGAGGEAGGAGVWRGENKPRPGRRARNGVTQEGRDYWSAGKPLYDPGQIRVPTFLAHAEWDQDLPSYMLYAYFEKLTNAPYKRYVEIGEGTHTVIMEKNRMQLFHAVQQFLHADLPPPQ